MIVIFPPGSERLVSEIYSLPAITTRGGRTVQALKLGTPSISLDGRLAFSYEFDDLHIEWLKKYAPVVEVVSLLPTGFVPVSDESTQVSLDLELDSKPQDPGALVEPVDKNEWLRPLLQAQINSLRGVRKSQWQATLPDSQFSRKGVGRIKRFINKALGEIKLVYTSYR